MSHYDEVLQEARSKTTTTAKDYIPRLYRILVDEENKTPEDARKIIEHDLLEYWSKATVKKFLPQETKNEELVERGKEGRKKQLLAAVAGKNQAELIPESPQQQDSRSSGSKEQERGKWDKDLDELGIDKEVPVKDSTQFYKEQVALGQGEPPLTQEAEEPTELELANIRIAQLEDALKKMEQFKPATQIPIDNSIVAGPTPEEYEKDVFEFLRKRDNKVTCFFYDGMGVGFFTSQVLTQLKGGGVKTFKRLYFEV